MTTITPTPGDPSTEPVATAQQSHVAGRVGPPTFAQDKANENYTPEGVEQIEPGEVRPADQPAESGPIGELADNPTGLAAEDDGDVSDDTPRKPTPSKRA